MLRRLALTFAVFLWLAPSMADAAPRYLVYVQHFPPTGADPAPDTACPMAPDGRFVAGVYRAQIVFFPSDAQRAQTIEGKMLGERLPRPWGAFGLAWATEGSGIGWLSSLSSPGSDDRVFVEVRPPLAPPLWMAPSQRGAPPPLPPLLEAIFRPLLPQGSSADLLKLFCAAEPRSAAADIQLVRIHRILAQPTSSADDIAAVREFLLPGQAAPDVNSWKALLDKASSASPAAFLFADYLGDKVFARQQYLYGRFVEEVRKRIGASRAKVVEQENTAASASVVGHNPSQSPSESPKDTSWAPGASALGIVILSVSCAGIVAFLILRRRNRPSGEKNEKVSVAQEAGIHALRVELDDIHGFLKHGLQIRLDGLDQRVLHVDELQNAVAQLGKRIERLESSLEMCDRSLRDASQKVSLGQAALEERLAAAERRLAEPPPDPVPAPAPAPVKDMLPTLTSEVDLGEEARLRLETAPSWDEFARRLVGEALPLRTAPDVLARIDARLAELSGQSVRLMIAGPGAKPNPEEVEKVSEIRIERGLPGHVIALLRPGLRVNGRIVRRAEVEVGI